MTADAFQKGLQRSSEPPSRRALLRRFNFAFRVTRDLEAALAVVNEWVDPPVCYRDLLDGVTPSRPRRRATR
ncbi:MAG: hypothetical protein ACYTFT_08015 [Planctomycetota bacterium]|jgi:hypothetical protein